MNFILLSDSQSTQVLCIKTFQDLKLDRYKILVQVVIGEQKGEGVKWVENCYIEWVSYIDYDLICSTLTNPFCSFNV